MFDHGTVQEKRGAPWGLIGGLAAVGVLIAAWFAIVS